MNSWLKLLVYPVLFAMAVVAVLVMAIVSVTLSFAEVPWLMVRTAAGCVWVGCFTGVLAVWFFRD